MTGDLLSVKEYAARQGMTEQAAYKQIRTGKIKATTIQENGKAKKYVYAPSQSGPDAIAEAPEQIQPTVPEPPAAEGSHHDPTAGKNDPDTDHTGAAVEKAVSALTAQLEEKDRQFKETVSALTAQLEEKDRQINRLTELLSQSHQLQAHSQKLLEQGAAQPPERNQEEPEKEPEPQEEPAPPKKKRSFWEWLSQI